MPDGESVLEEAISAQRHLLRGYERSSEPLTFETLRSLDQVFCQKLFPEANGSAVDADEACIMSAGGNHALRCILPRELGHGPFRLFPSKAGTQVRADAFVFACGVLGLAEQQAALLREGLLACEVREATSSGTRLPGGDRILVLTAASPSAYAESIGRRGQRWASAEVSLQDRGWEEQLERRHAVFRRATLALTHSR